MLGSPPGTHRTELAAAAPIPAAPSIGDMGKPADPLQRRPDLIAAERRLAASNARIGAAIGEYYPKLSLSALLGSATAVSAGTLFSGGATQAAGLLGLRWRLFDFGRINAEVGEAKGKDAEALAAYRQAVLHADETLLQAADARAQAQTESARAAIATFKALGGGWDTSADPVRLSSAD